MTAIPGVTVVNGEVMVRVNRIEQKRIISPPRFLLEIDIASSPTVLRDRQQRLDQQPLLIRQIREIGCSRHHP